MVSANTKIDGHQRCMHDTRMLLLPPYVALAIDHIWIDILQLLGERKHFEMQICVHVKQMQIISYSDP